MRVKRFEGLFIKAVVALSVIAIVPVLIIGYWITQINGRILKNELLQRQQIIANRLASTVQNTISAKEQLLKEFGDLHTDFGNYDLITQSDLAYLRARTDSLLYLIVFSRAGVEIFDSGTPPQSGFDTIKKEMMDTCLAGVNFLSDVYQVEGKPFIWLAEPLHRKIDDAKVTGVLAAAMYLDDIHDALMQVYPLDMESVLVARTGQILSSNQDTDTAEGQNKKFYENLANIREKLEQSHSAEITLNDGKRVLVSSARVVNAPWDIFVFQSADLPSQLFLDSLLHASLLDISVILLAMFVFVAVVSYLVIIPITRPLERLRKAVVSLREKEDVIIQAQDVEIPHNEIGELASVFVDMSQTLHQRRQELIKTQQELAQMNQVLEHRVEQRTRELKATTGELVKSERLAAIGQMASIISHEIRNPLAVISNSTRLIKTLLGPVDQKITKQFNIIEVEIRQANGIINEVLGYARTRELILSMVDVNSYLHDVVLLSSMPAGIVIKEELDSENVRIKVDAEEIKQALRNLIANAVESMPTGGTVTVGSKVGRRLVCLYVKDTGSGISEDLKQKIFSPFFTTKARGTGLGLAVVRKAITRHHGKLFIDSKPGEGSCFKIYLKIYRKPGDTNYGEAS